jgi:hypothetical protein
VPKQEHYTNIKGEKIDDKYCGLMDVAEKEEFILLKGMDNQSLELLSNIIYKMCKKENESCVNIVKSHERFYTKQLEFLIEDIEERYK